MSLNNSISESYQDEEPQADEARVAGESRPDGLVEAVVRARRRGRLAVESLSSSSDLSDGVTVAASHLDQPRNFIFYVMRQVLSEVTNQPFTPLL